MRIENIEKNRLYRDYKYRASVRNIEFNLTEDEFNEIVFGECFYCGYISQDDHNGIDRLRINDVYKVGECVSCCGICNLMKSCIDFNVFILICIHIAEYNKLNKKIYPEAFKNFPNKPIYKVYKLGALSRGYEFSITEEIFEETIKKDCYICGKSVDIGHYNGLDRKNNINGYIDYNYESCCSICNFMKSSLPYDIFLERCNSINNRHKDMQKKYKINVTDNMSPFIHH